MSTGKPFGRFERSLAWRYLRAKREHGGASLIAIISFVGIALAVAALIVTVSLMTGFRQTLVNSLIGGQGHIIISTNDLPEADGLAVIDIVSGLDGVESASPIIEEQVLLSANGAQAGAAVRGADLTKLRTPDGRLRFEWNGGDLYQRSALDPDLEWKLSLVKNSVTTSHPEYNEKAARSKLMSTDTKTQPRDGQGR